MSNPDKNIQLNCPIPKSDYPNIVMAHGGGGRLMHQLIEKIFMQAFGSPQLEAKHDGATIETGKGKLVFTTDSYVVSPLFFPGGDIGMLAVNGTVNDLAMCGALPLYLSAGFIIEEGLPIETLWKIALSMRQAADKAGVKIVTGDTKVVDKGKGDGLYINTAGVGVIEHHLYIHPSKIKPGDVVVINGDIGRHGIAVLAEREEFSFETKIESDCAPLADSVMKLIGSTAEVHCLRDLTRGGLATALVEIAKTSGLHIEIDEKAVPVCEGVQGTCEILGFDPMYIANEGRYIAFIPQKDAEKALKAMRSDTTGADSVIMARVTDQKSGLVTLKSRIGAQRIVDMLSGEQMPRIC